MVFNMSNWATIGLFGHCLWLHWDHYNNRTNLFIPQAWGVNVKQRVYKKHLTSDPTSTLSCFSSIPSLGCCSLIFHPFNLNWTKKFEGKYIPLVVQEKNQSILTPRFSWQMTKGSNLRNTCHLAQKQAYVFAFDCFWFWFMFVFLPGYRCITGSG